MTFSKSAQLSRPKPKSKRPTRDVKAFYGFVRSQPCIVPGCPRPSQAHHVHGGVSLKTGLPLRRRQGLAEALCANACDYHHNGSTVSIHALGEREFERHHGLPEFHLLKVAASLLAAWVAGQGLDS